MLFRSFERFYYLLSWYKISHKTYIVPIIICLKSDPCTLNVMTVSKQLLSVDFH